MKGRLQRPSIKNTQCRNVGPSFGPLRTTLNPLFLLFHFEKQSTFIDNSSESIDRPDEAPALGETRPSSILPPLVWHEIPDALNRKPWLMPFRDSILTTGLVLLAISAGLFGFYAFVLRTQPAAPDMMLFFLHYAWLPTWWLARFTVSRVGRAVPEKQTNWPGWSVGWGLATLGLGAVLMAFTARPTKQQTTHSELVTAFTKQNYMVCKITKDGFYQLTKPGLLLYVKPLPDWWSAEHSPAVCWRGGGYELRRVREERVAGKAVYTAELCHKNRPTLYTAWWFSNGTCQTIGQLDFRWQMMRGEPGFSLINITSEKPLITRRSRQKELLCIINP